ncbi:DUF6338 family protein [Acinetobacter pittii]|uniref:DUF6338 family protein n=1 Tax=Acinetobacter pittii TaxID=48296 RepID=UPI003AF8734F
MEIFETSKLILFILFAIPGFISIKTYSLLCPNQDKDSTKLLIDAITYSCLNYALLGPLIYMMIFSKKWEFICSFFTISFYSFVILIFPAFLAWGWLKLRNMEFFQKNAPHPTLRAWDYVFSKRKQYYILVTLSDGKKLAGEYSENSFTSSFPEEPQIFLEKAWEVSEEGGFERVRQQTEGILILSKDIQSIEFFHHN